MKRFTAATLAAATALSIATVPSQAAPATNAIEQARREQEVAKIYGFVGQNDGWLAMPNTETAGRMIGGSVAQGSSAEQAWAATQAGWILTWIAVSAAGLAGIAFIAQQAGLLPKGALPF